jgi:hypothetical protein
MRIVTGPLVTLAVALVLTAACGSSEANASPGATTGGSTTEGREGTGGGARRGRGRVDEGNLVIGTDACASDTECRPADCCHAAACVGAAQAPSCVDAVCTMECRANTIDCGGGCLCHQGRCAARIVRAADLGISVPP